MQQKQPFKTVVQGEKKYQNNNRGTGLVLSFRLNLLIGGALVAAALLILQLAMLQIVRGSEFKAEANRSDETVELTRVPRGVMYDSTGKVLVGNKPQQAITFTRAANATLSQMYATANTLGAYISVDTSKLSQSAEISYFLQDKTNYNQTLSSLNLTTKQINAMSSDDLNKALVAKKTDGNFHLSNDDQKNKAMIFQIMTSAYQLSTVSIKDQNVSDKELAVVGENLSSLSGVKISTSWSRDYPNGDVISSMLGNVTSTSAGLPADKLNIYLENGYSQDESVGVSGLEQQYETVLRGSAKQTTIQVNSSGDITSSQVTYDGQQGSNLNLTINSKLQDDLSNILKSHMPGGLAEGAYAVVINPYTGGVYAMVGWDRNNSNGQLTANAMGTINKPIIMGSAVKPAMLANALQHNIITPTNNTLVDQTIKIKGTADIKSYFNQSGTPTPLTAQQALEVSSNTYMVQLAMKLGGQTYSSGMTLALNDNIFDTLRNGFGQFGLGIKTGIDLPGESAGFAGPTTEQGKALNESFGNYDSYTVMQMARYVSTIANGGSLVKPYVVQNIVNPGINGNKDSVIYSAQTQVSGRVNLSTDQWNVITQGMYDVANGSNPNNTGGKALHEITPKINAKTGTAETFTNGQSTTTESLIAYVPGQPVAIALAFPGTANNSVGINTSTAKDIFDAFWNDVMPKP